MVLYCRKLPEGSLAESDVEVTPIALYNFEERALDGLYRSLRPLRGNHVCSRVLWLSVAAARVADCARTMDDRSAANARPLSIASRSSAVRHGF